MKRSHESIIRTTAKVFENQRMFWMMVLWPLAVWLLVGALTVYALFWASRKTGLLFAIDEKKVSCTDARKASRVGLGCCHHWGAGWTSNAND